MAEQKKTNSKRSTTSKPRKRHKPWPQTVKVVGLDDDNVKQVVCYEVTRRKGRIELVAISADVAVDGENDQCVPR